MTLQISEITIGLSLAHLQLLPRQQNFTCSMSFSQDQLYTK